MVPTINEASQHWHSPPSTFLSTMTNVAREIACSHAKFVDDEGETNHDHVELFGSPINDDEDFKEANMQLYKAKLEAN